MKRTEIKARPLADKTIAALEPEDKLYRERDSNSLYLYGLENALPQAGQLERGDTGL